MYLYRKVLLICGFIVFSFGNNIVGSKTTLNPSTVSSDFEETYKTELLNRSLDIEIRKEKLSQIRSEIFSSNRDTVTYEFEYTGSEQMFEVPDGASEIIIEAWGAEGQGGYGGLGGYVKGDLIEDIDEQFFIIYVGGQSGFNGGGIGHNNTLKNGGGASDVRINDNTLDNRIIVAGGGGAGGCADVGCYNGGSGGGGSCGGNYCGGAGGEGYGGDGEDGGEYGGSGDISPHSGGAGGGGYLSGGEGSCRNWAGGSSCGDDGNLGQGGNGDTWENGICYNSYGGTAGGGSGYYGGGGTSVGNCGGGAGGGGSSWSGDLSNPTFVTGVREGDGLVLIHVIQDNNSGCTTTIF